MIPQNPLTDPPPAINFDRSLIGSYPLRLIESTLFPKYTLSDIITDNTGKKKPKRILLTIFNLFRTVYERVSHHRTLAVFITSSVWHGFYPGYYMMFLTFGLMLEAGRMVTNVALIEFGKDL